MNSFYLLKSRFKIVLVFTVSFLCLNINSLFSQVGDKGIYSVRRGAGTPDVFYDYSTSGTSWYGNLHLGNGANDTLRPDTEFFLNKLFVTHRGRTSNNIFISSSTNGTSFSSDLYLGNGSQTSTCPRIVAFKNKLFIFHKGASTNDIHYNYSYNGSTWYGSYHLGNGAKTNASPEVIVFNNKLYLFHKGASSDDIFVCSSSDGVNWSSDLYLGNGAKTNDVHGLAATVFNNKIYLFHRGRTSDNIFVCSSSNGSSWSSDLYLGNGAKTSSAPTAATLGTKMYVLHKGSSSDNIFVCSSSDGSSWSSDLYLGNGAKSITGPSACDYDFNSIEGSYGSIPFSVSGSTVNNTNDWDVSGTDGADATYKFYVPSTKTLDITLCSSTTNYDTKLEVFYADMTSTGYYNDDASCSYGSLRSTISNVTLEKGYFYIVVDGYNGATGNYYLSVSESGLKSTKSSNNENVYDPQYEQEKDLMLKEKSLNLYPNPASKITTIETSDIIENLKIYNLSGKLVGDYTPNSNHYTLDVSQFSPGNYILKIIYKDMVETKKLIIQD